MHVNGKIVFANFNTNNAEVSLERLFCIERSSHTLQDRRYNSSKF